MIKTQIKEKGQEHIEIEEMTSAHPHVMMKFSTAQEPKPSGSSAETRVRQHSKPYTFVPFRRIRSLIHKTNLP